MTLPLWITTILAAAETIIAGWWKAAKSLRREQAEKSEREKSAKAALDVQRELEIMDDIDIARRAREWVRKD